MSKMVCESNDVRVNRFGDSSVYFFRYKKTQIKSVCRTDEEIGRLVRETINARSVIDKIAHCFFFKRMIKEKGK